MPEKAALAASMLEPLPMRWPTISLEEQPITKSWPGLSPA